ncbi:diguanylate cyclase [Deinococcus hopiensis]|uniref:diguanylate cyclase n=1 Tax=Deinococcus hopiensis TaxID=309885 RepID=UPI00148206F0|nr:diguanylate cyclase [Deinococcus hopiensis]
MNVSPQDPTSQHVMGLLQEAADLMRQDRLPEGIERAQEALSLAESARADVLTALAQFQLADLYRYIPRSLDAFQLLTQAVSTFRRANHPRLPRAIAVQGLILGDLGDHTAALDLYREALSYFTAFPEHADRTQEAFCYGALGVACTHLGEFDQAEAAYLRAMTVYEEAGNWVTVCHLWNNIVIVRTRALARDQAHGLPTGHLIEQAEAYLHRAEDLNARLVQSAFVTAVLCNSWGDLYALTGAYDLAVPQIQQALTIYRGLQLPRGEVDALTNLGEVELKQGQVEEAIGSFLQAQELVAHHELRDHERKLVELQAQAYEASGQFEQALAYQKRLHTMTFDLQQRETQKKLQRLAVQAEIERVQREAQQVRQQNEALSAQNHALQEKSQTLDRLAHQDALTGLANRRAFEEWEAGLPTPLRPNFALAVVDIDHFKRVNDTFSHAVGDDVLKQVAGLLRSGVREGDLVARFGGEEFVVVFQDLASSGLEERAEQLRARVEAHLWREMHAGLQVTISVGVAAAYEGATVQALFEQADGRLYVAKRGGRNRVVWN